MLTIDHPLTQVVLTCLSIVLYNIFGYGTFQPNVSVL